MFQFAPEFATLQRNAKPLIDQFSYRYNHSPELGVVYAIAQFGAQFLFQVMAVREDTAQGLESGQATPAMGLYRCNLKSRRDPQVLGVPAPAEGIADAKLLDAQPVPGHAISAAEATGRAQLWR